MPLGCGATARSTDPTGPGALTSRRPVHIISAVAGQRREAIPDRIESVSIRDVARSAGVSHMTVSRVINGHPSVSAATRQRVLATIRELGFRPSRTARDLSLGRSRSVVVMTSNTTLYGRAALLQGVEEAARAAGFHVTIGMLDSPRVADVRAAVDRLCDSTSGGAIVIAFDLPGVRALRAVPPGVPVVAALEVNDTRDSQTFTSTSLDDRVAAAMATRYLLDLGHHTVHHVAVPSSTRSSARVKGWRTALRQAGAPVPEVVWAGWTARSGYEAARHLAADGRVTAILCGNDDVALGVLHALREAGRAIPEAVSVVGFDDVPSAAFFAPPLTTVRLDFVGLGRDCFALLHHVLHPEKTPAVPVAGPPQLIVRETTGPAPRRRT
jgi:DNA-binding LacI/PurR family transcriptional regulator